MNVPDKLRSSPLVTGKKKIRNLPEATKFSNWWKFHRIWLTSALNKNENCSQQMQVIQG